jgi:hypothetical protein
MASPYLTDADNPELAARVRATVPGMAHFAGTGPEGKTCRECIEWTLVGRKRLCAKYRSLMDKWGDQYIPPLTAACKYFVQNE